MSVIEQIMRRVRRRRARMLVMQRYPLASEVSERPSIERGWSGELAARFLGR